MDEKKKRTTPASPLFLSFRAGGAPLPPSRRTQHPPPPPRTMSSAQRLPVVPTVTVLAVMKARLLGAVKGHALLKKKADALNMR